MVNQKRRTVLKSMSLLAALPVASLSALEVTQSSANKIFGMDSSQVIKREFTLTNLTPNTITLDKTTPISVPAYSDSSRVKFDMSKARGARLAPGGDITFDVFVAKDSMLEVSIDEVVIKSNKSNLDSIISAMNFTAQVSII